MLYDKPQGMYVYYNTVYTATLTNDTDTIESLYKDYLNSPQYIMLYVQENICRTLFIIICRQS